MSGENEDVGGCEICGDTAAPGMVKLCPLHRAEFLAWRGAGTPTHDTTEEDA